MKKLRMINKIIIEKNLQIYNVFRNGMIRNGVLYGKKGTA